MTAVKQTLDLAGMLTAVFAACYHSQAGFGPKMPKFICSAPIPGILSAENSLKTINYCLYRCPSQFVC